MAELDKARLLERLRGVSDIVAGSIMSVSVATTQPTGKMPAWTSIET